MREQIESLHHPAEDIQIDRRNALKKIVSIMIGAGVMGMAATSLFGFLGELDIQRPTNARPSSSSSTASSSETTFMSSQSALNNEETGSLISIKVVYFGMSTETAGIRQEYLTIPSPVFLSDVVSQVKQRHAILGPMLPTMQIVIDGNPAQGNPQLENHDEVDFVPTTAGG